jgi:hypothetical protein
VKSKGRMTGAQDGSNHSFGKYMKIKHKTLNMGCTPGAQSL